MYYMYRSLINVIPDLVGDLVNNRKYKFYPDPRMRLPAGRQAGMTERRPVSGINGNDKNKKDPAKIN